MKRSPIKPTSDKRAAEIKAGAKMSGTFKVDMTALQARGGTMSAKTKDTLFGKAKGFKSKRKATGEAKVFAEIWEQRPHQCEVCKEPIAEATASNFSHLLPKGSYRSMRLDLRNIILKCKACHDRWHQYGATGLRYSFHWFYVVRRYDELKTEYHQRLNAELSGKHGY